ncbi:hypothetical protein HHK36_010866 [Tetracentron sinense]|uniref:CCR4-NOT transcription complex subunit 4 n=1 Tax=Tetracentron sinense TaxID=13715 RepID=A0A834ZB42_TETSI|nr:hypothetical protein HHK36_010866 [Tetracentron sinense]
MIGTHKTAASRKRVCGFPALHRIAGLSRASPPPQKFIRFSIRHFCLAKFFKAKKTGSVKKTMGDQGEKICPLCTEDMDLTDQQLKPCKCGYEICVWCWHHIMDMAEKDDTEGRCPACRTPYDKEKIVGMAAKCERLVAEINSERKLKSHKAKPKPCEGRNHLNSVRVIQRNLVYIMGIPPNLADEDRLQHKEYFGQYGKVLKVSVSRTAGGAIQQSSNNTCSVYITYSKEEEAVRCIESVHGFVLDGRSLRACFGTTKYCHAWLRNVHCSNPDCLYLHDVGTQEDSFTKDEIISAYTRSRVQQIAGATNNLQRRSGNVLPPPADEYCNYNTASTGKPVVESAPNVRDSPPDGSTGRSLALPAAASWGMRVSNCWSSASSLACSNVHAKQKLDTFDGPLVLPSAVASTARTLTLHGDVAKNFIDAEESHAMHSNGSLGPLESTKQYIGSDFPTTAPETPAEVVLDATPTVTSSNHVPCLPASKDKDICVLKPSNITNSIDLTRHSCSAGPGKDENVDAEGKIQSLCSGLSSISIDSHLPDDHSDVIRIRPNSLVSNNFPIRSPGNQGLQQYYVEQFRDPLSSPALRKSATASNGVVIQRDKSGRLDSPTQVLQNTCSVVEEDSLAFDDERLKESEVANHQSYLPHSSHKFHSRCHSWQHSETCSTSNLNADPRIVHKKVDEAFVPFNSDDAVLSNGYNENKVGSSDELDRVWEQPSLFSNAKEGKYLGKFDDDLTNVVKNAAVDTGESSIISNILSMDFDSWDDSLTSPLNLAKLLSEPDKQHDSLKISSSWKAQNSNQSRFSFARQEDFANQATDLESSFSNIGHAPKRYSVLQEFVENKDPYLGMRRNGFSSSSFEESDSFPSGHSFISSNKLSVPRAQISAPPGFSVPSRAPPPGFSSHEKVDQAFNTTHGSHLLETSSSLRNQYQAPLTGNIGSIGDVEFIDPAILAVGKGRLPNGMNNSALDLRSTFSPQLTVSENEARLQLLMQQSISANQNLIFSDHIGDRFSPLSDAYGIPSRLVEQSQANNLSPFAQLSLQQSRNAHMLNGHWDGWNEVQSGNDLAMAELLRSERLGFNKFFSGYEDLQFRTPSSGDIYNRAFGM